MTRVSFEPTPGWSTVDPEGLVWRYRTRGAYGMLTFEREDSGVRRYVTTHVNETVTIGSRKKAVRFAMTGSVRRDGR